MAKKDWKCPFCGSSEPIIETPFMELNKQGEYVKKTQPCCRWSKQNRTWQTKHENPITHKKESLDDIAKW